MADYSINAVARKVSYTGSAGLGPYAFSFEILDDDDIAVYLNETLLTKTTDYTVTINVNGTGSVTLVTGGAIAVAPTASDLVVILGARDIERTTDFVTAGDLRASALNEQLDALTIFMQQIKEEVDRSVKAPAFDPTGIDMVLPKKADRVNAFIAFDANGDVSAAVPSDDVTTLAEVATDIATLADIEDGTIATDAISGAAAIASNITTVAGIAANVTTVAGNASNINAVAADATDIGTVATNIANVNTVAGISADVTAVAADATDIGTVATDLAGTDTIGTVAGIAGNVTTVAGVAANVTTVAGISSDVSAVAADATDIGTVATNIANVNTVADGINGGLDEASAVSYLPSGSGAVQTNVQAKLREFVSVKDFGADSTGTTDCTSIVQSLIDAAQAGTGPRAIFFPAGEYYFEPQSGLTNTCLQFAESDPTYQSQPEPIRIYGEGANSRIVVNNTGANNVWMAGPQGTASECVSAVFVEKLNFCSKSAAAADAPDRATYANNYLTMPNYARIFNVGRMWRCEFRDLFFEYCKGFFTENSGEDSNNNFAQQIIVDRCHSTAHQDHFIDLNQAWSCTFSNNTMESGNGCIKIGRSNAQSSYGVRIVNNTMQGNGGTYCGLRINYGSSIYIVGNYFESNRASAGVATPNIYMNNNTTESSIILDGNFFAQSATNLDGYGADYYHVTLDEVRNTVVFRGNTFSGGNGYLCSNTSDGYLISLGDKFEALGSIYAEGIVANNITFSDTIPIYKPATVWSPVVSDASSGGNTATATVSSPRYVRNGDLVTISAQILNIDTTGMTGGNTLYIQGLPFSAAAQGLSQGSCVLEQVTFTGFVVPQIPDNADYIVLRQSRSAGNDLSLTVGALSSGTADIQFTVTYRI